MTAAANFTLPAWCVAGASFRYTASPDPARHELWHVRGVVDGHAISRRWSPSKQRWHYEVQDAIWFHVAAESIKPEAKP